MQKEEFFREAIPESIGPLEGVKILEATNNAAGPFAGTLLVDLGAESIKIDTPQGGDIIRHVPPFVPSSSEMDKSAMHLTINRNKKGITLKLSTPKGQEIFKELTRKVDILIENFKPGTMDSWGLGYQHIRKIKPDIIYVSVSGYGQYGPNSSKPSYDAVGQAVGGLMAITGYPDTPPTRAGNGMADNISGWQGAFGALAALHYRNRTGKGQHVDVSQVDTMLYVSDMGIMAAAMLDYHWKRMGSQHPLVAPYNAFECKDGYAFIAIALDAHWARFCQIIGREELAKDPRFNSPANRNQNRSAANEVVAQWAKSQTVHEVVETFDKAELVAAPILDYNQALHDPHILQRDIITQIDHPAAGKLTLYGVATKFSLTPGKVRMPAPMMGQHNEEIYCGLLGYSKEELAQLKKEGVL